MSKEDCLKGLVWTWKKDRARTSVSQCSSELAKGVITLRPCDLEHENWVSVAPPDFLTASERDSVRFASLGGLIVLVTSLCDHQNGARDLTLIFKW